MSLTTLCGGIFFKIDILPGIELNKIFVRYSYLFGSHHHRSSMGVTQTGTVTVSNVKRMRTPILENRSRPSTPHKLPIVQNHTIILQYHTERIIHTNRQTQNHDSSNSLINVIAQLAVPVVKDYRIRRNCHGERILYRCQTAVRLHGDAVHSHHGRTDGGIFAPAHPAGCGPNGPCRSDREM